MKQTIAVGRYDSPVGRMAIGVCQQGVCMCDWIDGKHHTSNLKNIAKYLNAELQESSCELLCLTTTQLDEYFSGKRKEFSLPIVITGTDFQRRVREALLNIPYGSTISYGELARRLGNAKAVRAVATAVASNPISIMVPCHRVIGGNNSLIGYDGGLTAKVFLLNLESSQQSLFRR